MNAVAPRFASGEVFFAGVVVCVFAGFCLSLATRASLRAILRICLLVGIALVAASGTPLAWWHYAAWMALAGGFLLRKPVARMPGVSPPQAGLRIHLILSLTYSLALVALEARHHLAPDIAIPESARELHVIGDSLAMLSFDAGAEDRSWPQLLGDAIGLELIASTAGGATVASALSDAERHLRPGQLVLLEIGGNDMLFGTDPAAFRSDLDHLLAAAGGEGRIVVMFELPLPPFANRYGRIQRELAREHGARLIPKRTLTRVLGMPGATVDGLHLSVRGHAELAYAIAPLLHRP